MDFNHVKVEPARISAAADNIEENLNLMANAFNAISEAIQSNLQPSWQGTPAANFFAKAEKDAQTFNSHLNAIRTVTNKLKEVSGVYNQSENEALDMVRNLTLREGDGG